MLAATNLLEEGKAPSALCLEIERSDPVLGENAKVAGIYW